MSTVTQEPISGELVAGNIEAPIRFDVTNEAIATLRKKLSGLRARTPDGYKMVQAGIAETRDLRGKVEATRKRLKEKALTYGRLVDGEANRIKALLFEIEEPLKQEKEIADAEKERLKAEAEEAKRAALQGRIDSLVAVGAMVHPLLVGEWSEEEFQERLAEATEAFKVAQAKIEAEKAEAKRLEDEKAEALRIEQEKVAAERAELENLRAEALAREEAAREVRRAELAKIEAEQALERERLAAEQMALEEQNRIEREAIEAERRKLQEERDRIEREEFQRLETIRLEKEAVERAEQDRKNAERLAIEQAERERAESARLEALRPDAEKLKIFADGLRLLSYPEMATEEGLQFLQSAKFSIDAIARTCDSFGS